MSAPSNCEPAEAVTQVHRRRPSFAVHGPDTPRLGIIDAFAVTVKNKEDSTLMINMKSIVVALDLQDRGDARALDFAFELANATGAQVHLVHALLVKGASNLDGLPAEVVRDATSSAKARLKVLAVPYSDSKYLGEQIVRVGEPVTTLLHAAKDYRADLIVLGGPHRHGLTRALLGSVAEGVVRQASCPVLIMQPITHD
jgi:nucleotide-binding universal stress UspA family protein